MESLLVELAWKSAVISGGTLLLLHALRRRTAAERSLVAHSGLVATLLLPFAVLAIPADDVQGEVDRIVRAGITAILNFAPAQVQAPPGVTIKHVNMAMELEYAVDAGMSTLEAIRAATANGPLSVGEQAPRTGQLRAGYEADLIGLLENPVGDVRVLQKIDNVRWVWKGGKIFKGPGVGPWGEEL